MGEVVLYKIIMGDVLNILVVIVNNIFLDDIKMINGILNKICSL